MPATRLTRDRSPALLRRRATTSVDTWSFTATNEGTLYFICEVGGHCESAGQKVAITVCAAPGSHAPPWMSSPPPSAPPPSRSPLPPLFSISASSNGCQTVGTSCFTDGAGSYGNNERCSISVLHDTTLSSTSFSTEPNFDYLTVGGTRFSGTSGPQGVAASAGDVISWYTDGTGLLVNLSPFWSFLHGGGVM